MGTLIRLNVGAVSLDWAKNGLGFDHGILFQEGDKTRRWSDQIDYEWYEEHPGEDPTTAEAAFARPLARVVPRLELLGSTLATARAEYEALMVETEEFMREISTPSPGSRRMSFEEYCDFVCRFPICELDETPVAHDTNDWEQRVRGRFADFQTEIERLPIAQDSGLYWSEASYFGANICVLSAYSMLQVLAQSPRNAEIEVVWQYGPMVESGWVEERSVVPGAPRNLRILIVTEGSSDSRILANAINALRPDVSDFFRFIDVDISHPFWGTGNLVKFAEGLLRIDVLNRILFVLDNDAEGVDALNRLIKLGMPSNIRGMTLPDDDALRDFPAHGPQGVSNADINGRAAAIECYLDLRLDGYPPAQVLWTNYKKDVGVWHGVLDHKESYTREFLARTPESIRDGSYDVSKLERVVDAIVGEAARLITGGLDDTSLDPIHPSLAAPHLASGAALPHP